jgi:hypothetical protein
VLVGRGLVRRRLLAGLGAGAGLAAGFARSRLADAAPAGNLYIFTTPNGFARKACTYSGAGASFTVGGSLAPLLPYKDDLLVIRGLCNKSGSTLNSHEDMLKFATCRSGTNEVGVAYGPSFDQVMGQKLGTRPLSLALGSRGPSTYTSISFVAAGKADGYYNDPLSAFRAVWKSNGAAPSDAAARALLARRKSVLDMVKEDVARFRKRLPPQDAANLDLYLGSVRSLEASLTAAPKGGATPAAGCDGTRVGAAAMAGAAKGSDGAWKKAALDAHSQLVASSFACGLRRVATLGGADQVNPLGGKDHHSVSHGEAPYADWAAIDRWHVERFAFLLGQLEAVGQLGNTIVVWGSDISEAHNGCDFLTVVAGGRALGLRTGQAITYPFSQRGNAFLGQRAALAAALEPSHRSLADLWVSVQRALGVKEDRFGDHSSGGLPEVNPA